MLRKILLRPIKYNFSNRFQPLSRRKKIIQHVGEEILCDFSLINDPETSIESIIVLDNQLNHNLFAKCMPLTRNIILADGGANRFFETEFRDNEKVRSIVGNFDCIQEDVLQYYKDKKVFMNYVANLEDNDFSKSLEYCVQEKWNNVLCFGAFGGRMDQTLSGMHYSEKFTKMFPKLNIVLLGKNNLMFHLRKNIKYRIRISEDIISRFGCGIITFGKADNVETSGFKWNLGSEFKYNRMQWGSFISTSNEMVEDECSIISSCDIFFVANFAKNIRL